MARKQQPTLIIVHRRQFFDQWVDSSQSSLNIPKFQIGSIEGGKCETGKEITVALIQCLQTPNLPDGEKQKLYHEFVTIIVDECHHIPAKTFREVIRHFHSFYLYGLTASPIRKNMDEKLIFMHIGNIIHKENQVDIIQQYLTGICETITLTGEDAEQNKKGSFD